MLKRDDLGSLEPGKSADLAVWRTDGLELAGADDPVAGLVFSGPHRVDRLVVGGEDVVREGRLVQRRRGRDRAGAPRAQAEKFSAMSVSLSTHVLDTERGEPGSGVRVELCRGDELVAAAETDADGRCSACRGARARPLPPRLPAALAVLPARRAGARARGRPPPRAAARVVLRMRELPRQLSVEELAELFEGRTRLVELLASARTRSDRADDAIAELDEAEKLEALNAHPAIGARSRPVGALGRRAGRRRRPGDPRPSSPYLNQVYEEKFGFRFVVFVNRRPKTEILEVLRERLERTPRGGARDGAATSWSRSRVDRWETSAVVDPYANDWLSFLARWLHVIAGDRLDRDVVLLRRARQPPAPQDGTGGGSAASLGDPRRRLLPRAEVHASRRRGCPTPCTGSSGRRTRPGSPASRCWSSSTTSTRRRT